MKPIFFKESNKSHTRVNNATKQTETVHFYANGKSSVVCIKPTLIDRVRVLLGCNLFLIMKGSPAVFDLSTENPFIFVKK